MHIADGVLSAPVLVSGAVLTVGGTAMGLKKLDYDEIPRAALMSSVFFVASLIPFPLGVTSAHLMLSGLAGIVCGWTIFPVILVGLILQSVFFGHGGFTAIGVNAFNMAFPALLSYFIFRRVIASRKNGAEIFLYGFIAGALSIIIASIFTAVSLLLSGEKFANTALLLVAAHLPIMLIEGTITGFAVGFLKKMNPEIFEYRKDDQWNQSPDLLSVS